jgi:predicted dehydrogenase
MITVGLGEHAMSRVLTRRELLAGGAGAAIFSLAPSQAAAARSTDAGESPVRVGMVGVGQRGTSLLRVLLSMEGVEIKAIADITPGNLSHAQGLVEAKLGKRPEGYGEGPEDFRRLVQRDDIDAVIAATPRHWHSPVAVAAMRAKKYAAVEVPAAVTLADCWELVNTSEATGMPCMMLENVCYFRDMMMLLNMVHQGLLGELIHCAAGYQHDCRFLCFDEKGEFSETKFAPSEGGPRYQLWGTIDALQRNGNLYPTHAIGPIAQFMNINRGDRFLQLVSMSSKARGLNRWVKEKFGADHPNARRVFAQGDVNTTLIKTENGCTVALHFDVQSPRPYDLGFRVQGTQGIYMMEKDSIYLEGVSRPDTWQPLDDYRQKYEHPLWRKFSGAAGEFGHGGSDYITVHQFIQAVRDHAQPEQDVYDAATWSAIRPLTEMSVAQGSGAVAFPDFTRGRWKSRPPLTVAAG